MIGQLFRVACITNLHIAGTQGLREKVPEPDARCRPIEAQHTVLGLLGLADNGVAEMRYRLHFPLLSLWQPLSLLTVLALATVAARRCGKTC